MENKDDFRPSLLNAVFTWTCATLIWFLLAYLSVAVAEIFWRPNLGDTLFWYAKTIFGVTL